ncbi:MAG: hypothetical protein LQ351_006713 [Letrouitia transgressa]|nr:MAG: hypothetical protein LQ351_006713 [Letrouitia transgressa]
MPAHEYRRNERRRYSHSSSDGNYRRHRSRGGKSPPALADEDGKYRAPLIGSRRDKYDDRNGPNMNRESLSPPRMKSHRSRSRSDSWSPPRRKSYRSRSRSPLTSRRGGRRLSSTSRPPSWKTYHRNLANRSRSPLPRRDHRNGDREQRHRDGRDEHRRSRRGDESDEYRKSRRHRSRSRSLDPYRSKKHPSRRYNDRSLSRSPDRQPWRQSKHTHSHRHRSSPSPRPTKRSSRPLPPQKDVFTTQNPNASLSKRDRYSQHGTRPRSPSPPATGADAKPEKQKPNYAPTGLLAAASNRVADTNIVLKYHEPPNAKRPPPAQQYYLYVFKGDALLAKHVLNHKSCWLIGRESAVADVLTEHESCSAQHAVLQFRQVVRKDEYGEKKAEVGLYLLDLESGNGTVLNGERVEAARYVRVLDKDVVKFGGSGREYVVLILEKGDVKK